MISPIYDQADDTEVLENWFYKEEPSFTLEEAAVSSLEEMRHDVTMHLTTPVLNRLTSAQPTDEQDMTHIILSHLIRCSHCVFGLHQTLRVCNVPADHWSREIQQRSEQEKAQPGILLSSSQGKYIVSFRLDGEENYREAVASLPIFARHTPRAGERVLLWQQEEGNVLLGENWDAVRSMEVLETATSELSRQERLKPDFPYTRKQTEVLLKHASKW